MNRDTRHMAGFTLLEVLVAVAVFAVLSSLAYAGLTGMLEGRERIETERTQWRALALAMAQLEDDLGQARPRGVRDAAGVAELPPFSGQPVDPRPLGEPSLEFTRGGIYRSVAGTAPDLQRVAYRLTEGKLMRLTWPVLDRPPVTEPSAGELLSNIDNLTVRFHAPNGGWADRWPDRNDPTGMPDAVELAFDVPGVGRITRVLLVAQ